jgi:hypothetical protein
MTEYTRDIKQLTQTASSTPQFAAPSNSLGGDIVNAVGTGLQFFQQKQAQEKLSLAKEAMSIQEARRAEGQEKLLQINLLSQQGVTSTDILRRTEKLKRDYSPEEWWAIRKEANTVSGVTSAQAMSTADKAIEEEAEARRTLQEGVNKLSPFIPFEVPLDADEATLQQAKLIGEAKYADIQAKKARSDLENTQLAVAGKKTDLAREKFVIGFNGGMENVYVKQAFSYIAQANLNDPSQISNLLAMNANLERMYIDQAVKLAADSGVPLTHAQAREAFAPQLGVFDTVNRRLSGKDVKEVGANRLASLTSGAILAMNESGTPEQQSLASLFMFSPFLPKDALGSNILGAYASALSANVMAGGRGDMASVFSVNTKKQQDTTPPPPEVVKARAQEKQSRFQRIIDVFTTADENVSEETKAAYTDVVLEDLQGSNATQEDVISGGGLVTYVKAISKGTPANLLSADRQDEVMLGIVNYAEKFLRRAVPQLLTEQTPSDSSLFTKPIPPKGFNVGLPTTALENKLNTLDPETLKVTWNQKAAISNNVKSYNKFVDDLFISLDKLGATEDEIKYLKTEVSRAFIEANKVESAPITETPKETTPEPTPKLTQIDYSEYEDGIYEDEDGEKVRVRKGKVV